MTLNARMTELVAERVPFVHATVVRAQFPTSVRPGDDAIVLGDGSIEGFVGGHCAEGSVRTAALGALQDGETVLLRVLPPDGVDFPDSAGARVVVNPCLSGGALEIFLQPLLPGPLLWVVGHTPIANAMTIMGEPLGFVLGDSPAGATAVVIASHGTHEEESIRAALDAGVHFIGLVASHRRGTAVLAGMGLDDAERSRIRTPVGLPIGARTPSEVALSILADIVRAMRTEGLPPADTVVGPNAPPRQAVDPVCGMTVTIMADTPHLRDGETDVWFCNPGCRDSYAAR